MSPVLDLLHPVHSTGVHRQIGQQSVGRGRTCDGPVHVVFDLLCGACRTPHPHLGDVAVERTAGIVFCHAEAQAIAVGGHAAVLGRGKRFHLLTIDIQRHGGTIDDERQMRPHTGLDESGGGHHLIVGRRRPSRRHRPTSVDLPEEATTPVVTNGLCPVVHLAGFEPVLDGVGVTLHVADVWNGEGALREVERLAGIRLLVVHRQEAHALAGGRGKRVAAYEVHGLHGIERRVGGRGSYIIIGVPDGGEGLAIAQHTISHRLEGRLR